MRTFFVQHPDTSVGISEHHKVFSIDAGFNRRTIRLRYLLDQTHWRPMATHELSHGRLAYNTAEQFVLFRSDHGETSKWLAVMVLMTRL